MLPHLGTTQSGRFLDTFPWQQHSPTFPPHHFANSSLDGGLGMKPHMSVSINLAYLTLALTDTLWMNNSVPC